MGVFGTFCQICAMPLQHECYVPGDEPRMMLIYRSADEWDASHQRRFPLPHPFDASHDWLLRAVALRLDPAQTPQVNRGKVIDGDLIIEDPNNPNPVDEKGEPVPDYDRPCNDLEDGVGERCGLHEQCWLLASSKEYHDLKSIRESAGWTALEAKYHEQLFDFKAIVDNGEQWMLVDPSHDSEDGRRNRQRILDLITSAE